MNEKAGEREAMLLKIKAAEKHALKAEEEAKAKASKIRAKAQKEAANIIDGSEVEGRKQMRNSIEAIKKELDAIRSKRLEEAAQQGEDLKERVQAKVPEVTQWVLNRFRQEYDVKN